MSSSHLGTIIRVARLQKGLSLRELGDQVGITHATISRIENGLQAPKPESLDVIVTHLGLDLNALKRLSGKLRPEDVADLKRRPLAVELLRRMTDADVGDTRIGRMIKLAKE